MSLNLITLATVFPAARLLSGEQPPLVASMICGGSCRLGVRVERCPSGLAGRDQALDALRVGHVTHVAPAEACPVIGVGEESRRTSFVAGEIWRTTACHAMAFCWNRSWGVQRKKERVNPPSAASPPRRLAASVASGRDYPLAALAPGLGGPGPLSTRLVLFPLLVNPEHGQRRPGQSHTRSLPSSMTSDRPLRR